MIPSATTGSARVPTAGSHSHDIEGETFTGPASLVNPVATSDDQSALQTSAPSMQFQTMFAAGHVTRQVAARAFSHIVSLASKGILRVKQVICDDGYGPISLQFV